MTALKQHLPEYFHFRCKIELNLPVRSVWPAAAVVCLLRPSKEGPINAVLQQLEKGERGICLQRASKARARARHKRCQFIIAIIGGGRKGGRAELIEK